METKRRSSFFLSLQGVVAAASCKSVLAKADGLWDVDTADQGARFKPFGIRTIAVLAAIGVAFISGLFAGMLLYQPTVLVSAFTPSGTITFRRNSEQSGVIVDVTLDVTLQNVSRFAGQLKFSGSLGSSGIHLQGLLSASQYTTIMEGSILGVAIQTAEGVIDRSVVPLRPHANLPILMSFRGTRAGYGRLTFDDYIINELANMCAQQGKMIARAELETMNFFTLAGFASSHAHRSNVFEIICNTIDQ